jgi:hypothetical protein
MRADATKLRSIRFNTDPVTHLLSWSPARSPPSFGLWSSLWVVWEDGVAELVDGVATAWTKRAVGVRFGTPGHVHEVWVWAGAAERA